MLDIEIYWNGLRLQSRLSADWVHTVCSPMSPSEPITSLTEAHCYCQKFARVLTQLTPSTGAISGSLRKALRNCHLWYKTCETSAPIHNSIWRAHRASETTLDAYVLAAESEPLLQRALDVLLQHFRCEVLVTEGMQELVMDASISKDVELFKQVQRRPREGTEGWSTFHMEVGWVRLSCSVWRTKNSRETLL